MRMKMHIALDVDHTIMPKSQMGTMTLAMEQKWRKIVHHLVITKQVYKKELEVKQKVRLSLYQGRRSFNQGLYTLDDQYIHQEYQNYNI
jgi:hypothetical protein